jgi:hypothetical protein
MQKLTKASTKLQKHAPGQSTWKGTHGGEQKPEESDESKEASSREQTLG